MIPIRCGHCGKNLKVRDELAGKRAKCPGCGKPVAVPDPAASLSPQPSAPASGDERTLPPKAREPQQDAGDMTNLGAGRHEATQGFPRADGSRTVVLDEDARRRFETAWQAGKPVPIESFLTGQQVSHFLATLEELVHIDLEFRWKAWSEKVTPDGRPPDVESYLSRFPKLNRPEIVQRLAEQEFRLRHRYGDEPGVAEYQARFPGVQLTPVQTGPDMTSFLAPAEQHDEIGRLGPYRVLKVLGAGGMGVVFKAEDLGLRRLVALKAMLPTMASTPSAKERFFREARSAAALKHPHIVTIFQVGEDRGAPFLAMEFLEGEPLDERLKRERKLPVSEVLGIGRQVAEGLAAAHAKGLIHRDIKPANIWLESTCGLARDAKPQAAGQAKILDFGLARALSDRTHLTQTGAIIGTPAYMAPEQAGGKPVDHRCDLFSFGCVLYRMCTGEMAFKGDDTISILSAIALHTPAKPAELNVDVPEELSDLIMLLLAKEAEQRPFSAQEVAKALAEMETDDSDKTLEKSAKAKTGIRKAAAAKTVAALAPMGARQGDGTGRKKWPLLAGAGIVAAVALAIFFLASRERQRPEEGEKQAGPLPATFTNSLGMEFVLVPKGKSWLGGGNGKAGDKEVDIEQDFYLGKYEVTQEEWEKVTSGPNPSEFKAVADIKPDDQKRFPVEKVSWDDAQKFVKLLNQKTKEVGWVYRLPTEVEWEYACRGGPLADKSASTFHFYVKLPQNELLPQDGNVNGALGRTTKVGSYSPNRLGLFDMHGNVWEWCADAANPGDKALPPVCRGGSYNGATLYCAATNRYLIPSSARHNDVGLRMARVRADKESPKTFTNSLGMEFVLVPKGKSWLGGGGGKPGEKEVEIKDDFYLGKYEVTRAEWQRVMGGNGGKFKAVPGVSEEDLRRFPADGISEEMARQFVALVNDQCREAGWEYRLPTELEWEYACRGGPQSDKKSCAYHYYFDQPTNQLQPNQANYKQSDLRRPCKVGMYTPNSLGLYDMHGNLWERCADEVPSDPTKGVYRGGGWLYEAEKCTASARYLYARSSTSHSFGIRLARVPANKESPKTFTNSLGMEFVLVPKGKSWLGGGNGKAGDKGVEIAQDFYLGKYEVTQEEWQKVMGKNPSSFRAVAGVKPEDQKRFPVDTVSWETAQDFVKVLNVMTKEAGWVYRLPTEAEWEYACRGGPLSNGVQSAFAFYLQEPTNTLLPEQANFKSGEKSLQRTRKVGSYPPNWLGLHDMHGNVWEFCEDLVPNPSDPKAGSQQVVRGGSFRDDSEACRAVNRALGAPATQHDGLGLRLARVRVMDAIKTVPGKQSSAYDKLRREDIPPWELKAAGSGDPAKAAPELVAVLGDSRFQHPRLPGVRDCAALVWSPDEILIASVFGERAVRVWDAKTGELLKYLPLDADAGTLVFSPDGKELYATQPDGNIRAWDPRTGEKKAVPFQHPGATGLNFSSDGKKVVTGGDGKLKVWTSADGNLVGQVQNDPATAFALSPDGSRVALVKDKRLRLFNIADKTEEPTDGLPKEEQPVTFSPDGKLLATNPFSSFRITVCDLKTRKVIHRLDRPGGANVWSAVFSRDTQYLATCGAGPQIEIWDMRTGDLYRKIAGSANHLGVALAASEKRLAALGMDGRVRVWDLNGQELIAPGETAFIQRARATPDGVIGYSYVDGYNSPLRFWQLGNRQSRVLIRTSIHGNLEVNRDGTLLAYVQDSMGMVKFLNPQTSASPKTFDAPHKAGPNTNSMAVSPDWKRVALGWNQVTVWDVSTGKGKTHNFVGQWLSLTNDGKLVAGGQDLGVFDLASETWLWKHEKRHPIINDMRASPDGRLLAVAQWRDKELPTSLFEVATGKNLREFPHAGRVAFSPDSQKLATIAGAKAQIWNAQSGQLEKQIDLGAGQVAVDVDFASDVRHVIVANGNGTLFVLRLTALP